MSDKFSSTASAATHPQAGTRREAARIATAAVLVIGDEILSGKVRDENASFLIAELRELGVALRRILVVPDVLDEIAVAVRELSERFDHVFTSGGVGPTHDDLTMEGVARAFGQRVARRPELEQLLRDFYGARLAERDLRMADIPEGAELLSTAKSPWPVTLIRNVYVLPGVPEIFRAKFRNIRDRFRQSPFHLACVYSRDEEGLIAGHLDAVAAGYPDVALGSYPRIVAEGWKVKLTLESKDKSRVEEACAELVKRLAEAVLSVEAPR